MERDTAIVGSENGPVTTRVVTKRVVPIEELDSTLLSPATHEEWTTSKKKVNHKTKQVETRVQRQIVLEDGKVIADSGPQVTTRTTEDNKTEESENTEHKTSGDTPNESLMLSPSSAKVVSEKTEIHQTTKETKEENMRLHDESYRELTGTEYHQQALMSQEDSNTSLCIGSGGKACLPGKLTHYTSKSQKVTDKDEIKEMSELKDGELTTETTRTHHHEEQHDDEIPEDEVEEAGLPEISSETTRKIEYYNADDFDSLSEKIRKEKEKNIKRETALERKDPLTRRKLDLYQEEGIRNNETSRWLEDHFGSDGSDIVETTKTKSGGNLINIQMTPSRKPQPTCEHEHADDTIPRQTTAGRAHRSERITEKSPYNYSSNILSSNTARSSRYKAEEDVQKHNHIHTDVYQTPSRKASRSPTFNKSTFGGSTKTNNITDKKNIPKQTFYLGENGTYNTTFGKSLRESSPLQKNSFPWKSSPSITDDLARMYADEQKIRRHESFRNDVRTFGNKNVQRSQSQRGPAKNIPIRRTDFPTSPNHVTPTSGGYASQTLPRDTKFFSKHKNVNRCLFPSSCENLSSSHSTSFHNNSNNNSRVIQVELIDEKCRGSSPSFFHRPEAREPQTLPRTHSSSSPFIESPDSRVRSTSPYKSQNNFYFGDNSETRSYQNSLRKSTSESSNHYQDGIKTSDSFTFTPNPRSSKFRPSPRSELLNYRHYSNLEDMSHNYNTEKDRCIGDTLVKTNYSYENAYENFEPKNSGLVRIYSTAEQNSRNVQGGRKYQNQTEEVHQKSHSNVSYSDVNETRRNQFMKGLINSSDQISDSWTRKPQENYTNRRSNIDDHQRQSSLQVNYETSRSPSPRGRLIHDRPAMYTTPSEPSVSFNQTQHKGLLKTASFSRQRQDNKNRLQTPAGGLPSVPNPPAFTPLSCHLEIKNMSNISAKSDSKYEEHSHVGGYQNKSLSKTGPIMVEIRDWDSR